MKKFVAGLVCGAVLMLSTSVFADGAVKQIMAFLTPDISVELDGQKVALQNAPVNYDGSIYLPVREIAGVVGVSVDWDDNTRAAKLSSKKNAGALKPKATPNAGETENIPQISKNGHVYIGLTAWQNKQNAKVTIDYKKRTITIERQGYPTIVVDSNNENEYLIQDSISYINSTLVE